MLKRLFRALRGGGSRPPTTTEDWHREGVGGMWEEIGKLQFDFLVERGLKPDHYLLDIGCGSLRGGVHFIRYLSKGRYFGVEKEESLLEAGRRVELKRYALEEKEPQLFAVDDFDLSALPPEVQFDFMLAQSVFTHLTPELIELCVGRVTPRLSEKGVFYATFDESPDDKSYSRGPHKWRRDELRMVYYPFSLFEDISRRTGGTVDYIGEWSHPGHQKMMAFRSSASEVGDKAASAAT